MPLEVNTKIKSHDTYSKFCSDDALECKTSNATIFPNPSIRKKKHESGPRFKTQRGRSESGSIMVNHLDVEVLSEKTLQHAVDPRLISYCPSMDLVALVTTDQQVFIYRMNGQRVYSTLQRAGDLRVESIQWKPNGLASTLPLAKQQLTSGQGNSLQSHGVMDPFVLLELRATRSCTNLALLKDLKVSRA
jgi:hypothetical protein